MDLRPLFQPQFWFDLTPTSFSPVLGKLLFIVFALFIVAGAVLRIVSKGKDLDKYIRVLVKKSASSAMAFGVVGFVIYFFTFEEVQFFGSRFWFLLWFVALVIVVLRLVRFYKKEIPLMRKRDQSRADTNKYLPRRS